MVDMNTGYVKKVGDHPPAEKKEGEGGDDTKIVISDKRATYLDTFQDQSIIKVSLPISSVKSREISEEERKTIQDSSNQG